MAKKPSGPISFELNRSWLGNLISSQTKITSKALMPFSKGIQFLITDGTLYVTAIGDNAIMSGKTKVDTPDCNVIFPAEKLDHIINNSTTDMAIFTEGPKSWEIKTNGKYQIACMADIQLFPDFKKILKSKTNIYKGELKPIIDAFQVCSACTINEPALPELSAIRWNNSTIMASDRMKIAYCKVETSDCKLMVPASSIGLLEALDEKGDVCVSTESWLVFRDKEKQIGLRLLSLEGTTNLLELFGKFSKELKQSFEVKRNALLNAIERCSFASRNITIQFGQDRIKLTAAGESEAAAESVSGKSKGSTVSITMDSGTAISSLKLFKAEIVTILYESSIRPIKIIGDGIEVIATVMGE